MQAAHPYHNSNSKYAAGIVIKQMVLDSRIQNKIQLKIYHGGHMPYLHQGMLDFIFEDVLGFTNWCHDLFRDRIYIVGIFNQNNSCSIMHPPSWPETSRWKLQAVKMVHIANNEKNKVS